jgi:hypothetical protein
MIETFRLSLQEFRHMSATTDQGLGDVVDALRTVYWFHSLQRQLGVKSADAMSALLEGEELSPSGAVKDLKRKWRNYRCGRYKPRPQLIELVDRRCPGSRRLLDHVFWDAIRLDLPVARYCEIWLSRLHPEVQAIAWRRSDLYSNDSRLRNLTSRQIRRLERCVSLDSLACLIIVMRESVDAKDFALTQELAHAVRRMLLLMAQELRMHGIALPLADYLDANVLPAIPCLGFGAAGFLNAGERLVWAERVLQPVFESRRTRARILQAALDGPRSNRSPWCRIARCETPDHSVE